MKVLSHVLIICAVTAAAGADAAARDSGADYLQQPMPESWSYDSAVTSATPDDSGWWKGFNDPLLDSLVNAALNGNYDVRLAARRILSARAQVRQAAAAYWPTIGVSAGYSRDQSAGAIRSRSTPSSTSGYFSAGVDVSWEIDLFGRVTRQVKRGKAQEAVSRADMRAVAVSLVANVAEAYVNLRMYQSQLLVAREHLKSQARVVEIAEARHEAGLASELDPAQARTVLYSTEAAIPALEESVHTTVNAIALLLGVYPDSLAPRLENSFVRPDYRRIVAAGVPMDLLRRRPDVVEAEKQLAVYAAELGIAKGDFMPTLTLQGSIGTAAGRADGLFGRNSLQYSVAPTLSWTVFDGLARNAAVAEARYQMESGIDHYNLTVMTAVQEVDNAIASYAAALRTIELTTQVNEWSRKEFDLAIEQYKEGLSAFTNVAQAQISLLETANSLVQSRASALKSLIQLYQALGGAPQ